MRLVRFGWAPLSLSLNAPDGQPHSGPLIWSFSRKYKKESPDYTQVDLNVLLTIVIFWPIFYRLENTHPSQWIRQSWLGCRRACGLVCGIFFMIWNQVYSMANMIFFSINRVCIQQIPILLSRINPTHYDRDLRNIDNPSQP